uniref:Tyrosine-protein phosphatase domain-containing protein n=1 Tax=Heterorhabditis bacteriophora TaxID=37862 RepID=A0A1I7X0Q5_HETBA
MEAGWRNRIIVRMNNIVCSHSIMAQCWERQLEQRPEFSTIRQNLASQLEEITEEYSYLKLDAQRDYYNVQYGDQKPDVMVIPESSQIQSENSSLSGDTI